MHFSVGIQTPPWPTARRSKWSQKSLGHMLALDNSAKWTDQLILISCSWNQGGVMSRSGALHHKTGLSERNCILDLFFFKCVIPSEPKVTFSSPLKTKWSFCYILCNLWLLSWICKRQLSFFCPFRLPSHTSHFTEHFYIYHIYHQFTKTDDHKIVRKEYYT